MRPVSYVTKVPKDVQRQTGRGPANARARSDDELRQGIREWIDKKFDQPEKQRLRQKLATGPWSRELVVHVVRYAHELDLIAEAAITVHRLADIVATLKQRGSTILDGAAGAHLLDLVAMPATLSEASHVQTGGER